MKVLVVDDEEDMQTLFLQKFRKEIKAQQIEFAFANSGHEALNYLSQHSHEAVPVLSDVNMPGMSGFELLENIRKKFTAPQLTVIMVTAYGDSDNHERAMQLGANDFLTKPVDFALLKEKLKIEPDRICT
jgi:CheY-like chemotaxis protein